MRADSFSVALQQLIGASRVAARPQGRGATRAVTPRSARHARRVRAAGEGPRSGDCPSVIGASCHGASTPVRPAPSSGTTQSSGAELAVGPQHPDRAMPVLSRTARPSTWFSLLVRLAPADGAQNRTVPRTRLPTGGGLGLTPRPPAAARNGGVLAGTSRRISSRATSSRATWSHRAPGARAGRLLLIQ